MSSNNDSMEVGRSWAHLETQIKVVFSSTRHDPMKAIHRVRNAKVCREQSVDLSSVCQVCFDQESLHIFRCFGLDHIGENELNVGRPRVVPQFSSDLRATSRLIRVRMEQRDPTRLPNQPAAPVMRTTLDMADDPKEGRT